MDDIEQLMYRAENLLRFMPEHEAAAHLLAQGLPEGMVFLVIKAAQVSPEPIQAMKGKVRWTIKP